MAGANVGTTQPAIASAESDYGSDLDEATVEQIFSQASPKSQQRVKSIPVIEKPEILDDHGDGRPLARLARIRDDLTQVIAQLSGAQERLAGGGRSVDREVSVEVGHGDGPAAGAISPHRVGGDESQRNLERETKAEADLTLEEEDTRTPIQRFRTQPKKPLSVTDLISPAWCELQYWYSLTKYGRVKRTAAMKQGSKVHKKLEEQVHTEVPVDVQTKEDRFALRIWNIIQGLRTLTRTGMTRELEVWGIVDGEVVNGIIDQITTSCPDPDAEAEILRPSSSKPASAPPDHTNKSKPTLPQSQQSLTSYLTSSHPSSASILEHHAGFLGTLHETPKTLYILDVKTRQSNSLPSHGSQSRPVHYQLMLYHRLFSTLAADGVDASKIFARYGVDPTAPFSDVFIAQMSSFAPASEHQGAHDPSRDEDEAPHDPPQDDSLSEILQHNTLSKLWSRMIREFSRAVPVPSSPPSTSPISALLTVEFRSAKSGDLVGRRHFRFEREVLDRYLRAEMEWWRGERGARGVEVEEAFKCRGCEFAGGCGWRLGKVEEGVLRGRRRREGGSVD